MNDLHSIETTHHFYTELINRFFHPKSYFFVCVQNFLKKNSSIAIPVDESLIQILTQLVQYLIQSKHPAYELKEITQINDFKNLYADFENQLDQLNLHSLDQPKLKLTIKNMALYFLKEIYQILATNKKSQDILVTYVKIKTQLRDLLNGSNGKHTNQDLNSSQPPTLANLSEHAVVHRTGAFFTGSADTANDSPINTPTPTEQQNPANVKIDATIINEGQVTPIELFTTNDITTTEESDFQPPQATGQDNHRFKLAPDDDEELLKLIQDMNVPESNNKISTHNDVINSDTNLATKDETIQEQPQEAEASLSKVFQQEAELYFQILLKAISQLKSEEKIQSALEDIELASSSLKNLAQKFGLEKIALLPELIESISIIANKHLIKLSAAILQNIEDGILLVKEFNHNNADHKLKFMSILASLKEYYSITVKTLKEISNAS